MSQTPPDPYERFGVQLDELTRAVTQLVRVDERQIQHSKRLDKLEIAQEQQAARLGEQRDELSKWVNRGFGLWGGLATLWAAVNSPLGTRLLGGG